MFGPEYMKLIHSSTSLKNDEKSPRNGIRFSPLDRRKGLKKIHPIRVIFFRRRAQQTDYANFQRILFSAQTTVLNIQLTVELDHVKCIVEWYRHGSK